ncbi:MAG: hypothetical protein V4628_17510, partial [Pseudomonadota bacterium]
VMFKQLPHLSVNCISKLKHWDNRIHMTRNHARDDIDNVRIIVTCPDALRRWSVRVSQTQAALAEKTQQATRYSRLPKLNNAAFGGANVTESLNSTNFKQKKTALRPMPFFYRYYLCN